MENKKWAPSQEENFGVVTSVYESIKEELLELQKKTGCPNSFIFGRKNNNPSSFIFTTISFNLKMPITINSFW